MDAPHPSLRSRPRRPPALGLPAPTAFDSFLLLHNFNAHQLPVNLSVGYSNAGAPQEVQLPLSLAPGENQVVSLSSLLGPAADNIGWGWLELSYTDRHNGLVAALVSVSQDGEHSIRSVLNWVEGSFREGWLWRADANYNTFLGILNTDTEEARVQVSLDYYDQGLRRSYELPELTLPARASELIDIGALIAAAVPDEDGDTIPAAVTTGGYRLYKVGPRLAQTVTTEALVFDRQRKSFLTFYNTCCGFNQIQVNPGQFIDVVGFSGQLLVEGRDRCTGAWQDATTSAFYSSFNTAVATVGPPAGAVSGVGVGSTTVRSELEWSKPFHFDPSICISFSVGDDTDTTVTGCGDVRDQIRQEYEVRFIPVPACGEFTQTKYSTHFFFAEMNGGDYSWAIITDRLLTRLEQTRVNLGNQPINVISGYRNPVKNASVNGRLLSRHQYGDAADSCPSDYNSDGVVNSADQAILVTAAQEANVGFNEIVLEPLTCVHLGSL